MRTQSDNIGVLEIMKNFDDPNGAQRIQFNDRIFVAGHTGLVGSSVVSELKKNGYHNLILKSHKDLELTDQSSVINFFEQNEPEIVIICAAKVGGILNNREHQADFLYENLAIANNIIHTSYKTKVKKLIYLGSSCIYPKHASQPLCEEYLLNGTLEPTNEGYAIAKIAGLKLCEKYRHQYSCDFISCMPTNLYGPHDNYHETNSHVIPGLIRKMHFAKLRNEKTVEVWGDGNAKREFLYVTDLAKAILLLMETASNKIFPPTSSLNWINVGSGSDLQIRDLALLIKKITGYPGDLIFKHHDLNGTMQKLLDGSKIKLLGWAPQVGLEQGLRLSYEWAIKNKF